MFGWYRLFRLASMERLVEAAYDTESGLFGSDGEVADTDTRGRKIAKEAGTAIIVHTASNIGSALLFFLVSGPLRCGGFGLRRGSLMPDLDEGRDWKPKGEVVSERVKGEKP